MKPKYFNSDPDWLIHIVYLYQPIRVDYVTPVCLAVFIDILQSNHKIMAEQESLEYGKGDFVLLDEVTKSAFMENLQLRFSKEKIYTFIGEVIVSVNPYKTLDIYGSDDVKEYQKSEIYEKPPHLFALANAAYRTMKRNSQDSCIIISGKCLAALQTLRNNSLKCHCHN